MRKKMKKIHTMNTKLNNVRHAAVTALKKKEKGLDGLFVTIGIIIVAVILLVVFRDQAKTMVTTFLNTLQQGINTTLTNGWR